MFSNLASAFIFELYKMGNYQSIKQNMLRKVYIKSI